MVPILLMIRRHKYRVRAVPPWTPPRASRSLVRLSSAEPLPAASLDRCPANLSRSLPVAIH